MSILFMADVQYMLHIINQISFTALNFSSRNKNAGSTSNLGRGSDIDPPEDKH